MPAPPSKLFSRRDWLRHSGIGLVGTAACSWLPAFAEQAGRAKRHVVLLWMGGGPAQTDTFDMKVGHANGGEFKEIATNLPGIRFSEHLPKLAQQADKLAILRSLSTKEGDHGRGAFLVRTGQQPGAAVRYPTIGSSLSRQLGAAEAELPNYVSIGNNAGLNPAAFGSGFLGPQYAAATVTVRNPQPDEADPADASATLADLGVDFLQAADEVQSEQAARRLELWREMQRGFLAEHPHAATAVAQDTVYRRAVRMMQSQARDAFDLSGETEAIRRAYGAGVFGQGCLMARRLIERGVPCVEVALGGNGLGWDTHQDNFARVRSLSQQLDAGWSSLMSDLEQRGLLESTTILWIGEFGRTPTINPSGGRDHFPQAWSCVLAGGGIQGGQAYGKTSDSGVEVVDNPVDQRRVLATLCRAVGVDPAHEFITRLGRPVKIVDGQPIDELLV